MLVLKLLLLFLLVYAVGTGITYVLRLRTGDALTGIFSGIALGGLSLSFLYAVYCTRGDTSLWVIVPYLAYLYYYRKNAPGDLSQPDIAGSPAYIWSMLTAIAVLLFAWLVQMVMLNHDADTMRVIDMDIDFYASLADVMQMTGKEVSAPLNVLLGFPATIQPYHYIDLWHLGVFSWITQINIKEAYFNLYFSITATCLVLGMFSAARKLWVDMPFFTRLALAVFCVFSVSLLPYRDGGWPYNIFLMPKINIVFIWTMFSFVMTRSIRDFLVINSLVCFFNILVAPVYVLVILIHHLYTERSVKPLRFLKEYRVFIIAGIFFVAYYIIHYQAGPAFANTEKFDVLGYIYGVLKQFFREWMARYLFFNPVFALLLLFIFLYKKNLLLSNYNRLFAVIVVVAAFASAVLNFFNDSCQVFDITNATVLPIWLFLLFSQLYQLKRKVFYAMLVLFGICTFFNYYSRADSEYYQYISKDFLKEVEDKEVFRDDSVNLVLHMVRNERHIPIQNFEASRALGATTDHLFFMQFNFKDEVDSVYQKNYFQLFSSYPVFVEREKNRSMNDSVFFDFLVNKYNIRHFITEREEYPAWIDARFSHRVKDKHGNTVLLYNK